MTQAAGELQLPHEFTTLPVDLAANDQKHLSIPTLFAAAGGVPRHALDLAQKEPAHAVLRDSTPMFFHIVDQLGMTGILHVNYQSTRAKLPSLGLQANVAADGITSSKRKLIMPIDTLKTEDLLHETSDEIAREESLKGDTTLSSDLLRQMNAYWRAANYVSVGQIYLYDNPLLKEPLKLEHVKPLVVSHWGTTPGQNFVYVHLNRAIKKYDLNMFYIAGPGHGGPAIVGNVYLEGTWSEVYPDVTQDEAGLKKLFKQFSFPGGISSHVAPTTPGSIHEGGELGYSLSHAFGAAFDNPDLLVACVIGDGEAETGSLATSWQSNKFLDPKTDGAVLPILHLNGYKISNPTVLARIEHEELDQFLKGCGWNPYFVEGDEPELMHELMATTVDRAIEDIHRFQNDARTGNTTTRPRWPVIVLKSPKGWTGPKVVDGLQIEGTFRSHQVPLLVDPQHPDHVELLEAWMKSYKPEELFDQDGRLIAELARLAPKGDRRMGANPHANGGLLLRDLIMPDFHDHAVIVNSPGAIEMEDTLVLGSFLRDVARLNKDKGNFPGLRPRRDDLESFAGCSLRSPAGNGMRVHSSNDEFLAPAGRVLDSMLSENQCEGWLEGYLSDWKARAFQ